MALNTSEHAEVNRIYENSVKQVLVGWNYLFLLNGISTSETSVACYGKKYNVNKDQMLKLTEKGKKLSKAALL